MKFDINEYGVSILFPKFYITFLNNFKPFPSTKAITVISAWL